MIVAGGSPIIFFTYNFPYFLTLSMTDSAIRLAPLLWRLDAG
jgi:hypothetical protein